MKAENLEPYMLYGQYERGNIHVCMFICQKENVYHFQNIGNHGNFYLNDEDIKQLFKVQNEILQKYHENVLINLQADIEDINEKLKKLQKEYNHSKKILDELKKENPELFV